MGLAEQFAAGARFTRTNKSFISDPIGTGSVDIASTYVILSIQTNKNIRLRLYDNYSSLMDAGEIARPFGNMSVSNSIALVADISMSAGSYTLDPPMYAISEDYTTPTTYYRVENDSEARILINYYPLESSVITPTPNTAYSLSNRRTLLISRSISMGGRLDGVFPTGINVNENVPATYLLISASLLDPTQVARLRLYSTAFYHFTNDGPSTSRPFGVEPAPETPLIADLIISGSEPIYFSPKIIGSNIQYTQIIADDDPDTFRDLLDLRNDPSRMESSGKIYYTLQNLGASDASITASIHLYALED